jgi:hypothetical protein
VSTSRRSGNVGVGVIALIILGAIGMSLSMLSKMRFEWGLREARDTEKSLAVKFGIETFLLAYRHEESKYYRAVTGALCDSARPFYLALAPQGSGCVGLNAKAFEEAASPYPSLLWFPSAGCNVDTNSGNCQRFPSAIVEIGFQEAQAAQRISGHGFRFFIQDVIIPSQLVEFGVDVRLPDGRVVRERFAIRNSFRNAAHIESTGQVVQQKPDPFSLCPGQEWMLYRIPVGSQCLSFSQLGGGLGLAFHNDYYFGFRPAEGLIVSLDQLTTTSSYIVEESGAVPGLGNFFPLHNRLNLIDADDITVSSSQLYFVKGQGSFVAIRAINPVDPAGDPVSVCRLGQMGWSQSYVGLASLSSNDPLLPDPAQPFSGTRSATFFLKTWSGAIITAVVTADGAGTYNCFATMDPNVQAVENMRTWGFDRAKAERPYFVY